MSEPMEFGMSEPMEFSLDEIRQQCIVGAFSHLEHIEWIDLARSLLRFYDAKCHQARRDARSVARLQELVAGAHALRCACAGPGPLRDPRCAELQGMAGD